MLVDLARPPVTTVTNLQDSEQMYIVGFSLCLQSGFTDLPAFLFPADVSHPVVKNSAK